MAAFFLLTSMGWAQDNTYDISLGGSAVFSKQSTGNGTVLTPTNSGAVLVTGRYRFSEHSSVEINYSHTSNSQIYFCLAADLSHSGHHRGILRGLRFQFPPEPKVEPFVFAGAGALVFYPGYSSNTINGVQTYLPASQQTQPAFLYGGGFDWRIFSILPLIRRSSLTNIWLCGCNTGGWSTRRPLSMCRTCLPAPEDTWRSLRWGSW